MTSDAGTTQKNFSSLWGFLLSIIGFAVGVGSMWRFPYVAGTNGGALFIFTYMAVILLIGIPMLTAEIAIGYSARKMPVYAYKKLHPKSAWYWVGYLHFIVGLLIFSYTTPIFAWILVYIWRTGSAFFAGMMPQDVQASFIALTGDYKTMFLFSAINLALIALVCKSDMEKGIERLNKILLPLLAVIMVVCIAIGLQYDNASAGVAWMFKPDWGQFSLKSVHAAIGQAFFAIGIGMLGSMVFGSYIKGEQAKLLRMSGIVCVAIVVAGIASGLMIFPVVFAFGLEPAAGAGLTLITLPNVFNHMRGGQWVGVLFYAGFYFAAFTSAIGLCESAISVVMATLDTSRKRALTMVMLMASIITACTIVVPGFLDAVDNITSSYLLIVSGLLLTIFAGWVWGTESFLQAASVQHPLLRLWLAWSVKYLCPLAIVFIFIGKFW